MAWVTLAGVIVMVFAHVAPARFLLDRMAGDRAVWRMPRDGPPTVYLTYDDGPNPTTTPDLLDVLARERAHATFFLIDRHVTDETAPIVRRMFAEGHAVALHSAARGDILGPPSAIARRLTAAAGRIAEIAGRPPCRAFRPHAGWRGGELYVALRQLDYRLVGWGWMRWDWNGFRPRTADSIVNRVATRIASGDIVVIHDGDESAPRVDQRQAVDATARLLPALRARGFQFGTVCENGVPPPGPGGDEKGEGHDRW